MSEHLLDGQELLLLLKRAYVAFVSAKISTWAKLNYNTTTIQQQTNKQKTKKMLFIIQDAFYYGVSCQVIK